ncbi:hypothetical protein [Citrobacter amalonaticus]|uniref:hypothetical protein n=1 Tax=Citrobacter amalonaticus TaxID=35703 RepID=UPI00215C97B7|nr:hypothetical protein [Citrobacter amalonaticus]MCR9031294.1 hypothetical protein [Citrobacter amalonaticus]MDL4616986.1 hypothetical protein [Citrobacter amalonaticus]MDL4621084.1 hypothetical protein [Citrobacter amalonaticus]
MSQIKVKAAPGVKVPREGNPRRYITSEDIATVEDTAYYRRQMMAGDLVAVSDAEAKKAAKTTDKTQEVNSVQS